MDDEVWRGLVCRLAMLSPSTTTWTPPAPEPRRKTLRAALGAAVRRITRSTVPRLPASLPARTTTVSPLRISGTLGRRGSADPDGHHSTSGASETIFM